VSLRKNLKKTLPCKNLTSSGLCDFKKTLKNYYQKTFGKLELSVTFAPAETASVHWFIGVRKRKRIKFKNYFQKACPVKKNAYFCTRFENESEKKKE